jgi:glycosyltransferase involved in cell wall biosynthesis
MAGIAKHLDRSRFDPHVCVFRAGWNTPEELASFNVPVFHLPVRSFRSVSALRFAGDLYRYLRRHRIALTHSWDSPTNIFSLPIARAARVRAALTSQRCHRSLTRPPYLSILRVTDHLADGIVVNSRFLADHLVNDEKAPAAKVHRCINGVDIEKYTAAPGQSRPPILQSAGMVVGVVCLLRPAKNLQLLLRAFAKVRNLRPDLKLLIVGDGPERDPLMALRRELGLDESQCIFEPVTKDVPYWLRAIDIFVLPSLSESLSNSLIEAMAMGRCALATSIEGNLELIEHGRTGLLFRSDDVDSLAAELKLAIEDDALRMRLGENASTFARRLFSWENAARNMERIYLQALCKHSSEAALGEGAARCRTKCSGSAVNEPQRAIWEPALRT